MRWWIVVVIALLLSGCGGVSTTRTGNGGFIYHSPTESVFYSPKTDSHQTMSPDQARKTLPELFLHGSKEMAMQLNRDDITQVRIRHGLIEITANQETLAVPLKNMNVDVIKAPEGVWGNQLVINLTGKAQISSGWSDDYEHMKPIADALYVLKRAAIDGGDESAFAETARTYREATTKPVLPEAARRLKVQAEDAVQDKKFEDAADLYEEALHLVPWWPSGHFNLAVISSETGDFELAVREMKRYLLLVPNAPDAHEAQNYVYKWERKAGTSN